MSNFLRELETLINRYSKENDSDTPDFILAEYLNDCLEVYSKALNSREKWYGRPIGGTPITQLEVDPPSSLEPVHTTIDPKHTNSI